MRYKLALILGAALLAAAGLAALERPKSKDLEAAKANASSPLRCTLTGKTIESCCCTEKDGASTFAQRGEPQPNHKLYCPLAKKTIESCCCVPANAAKATSEDGDEEPLRCGRDQKSAANCCAHGQQEKKKEN
jgi:hypothetical protein